MKAEITKKFVLEKDVETVWKNFSTLESVVSCVPGASLTEKIDDKHYKGEVELKVGPIKAKYGGLLEFLELDHEKHHMSLKGTGVDSKGKGGANMDMKADCKSVENGTEINVVMEVNVSGMIAQFGSRLMHDATNQVFEQFVNNFKAKLAGETVDNTLKVGSIVGGMVKGLFKK